MALPLKSGADLYNQQALRLRLHNLGADPLEVGEGLIYYNTSTGLNTSGKARIYTGAGWKTLAFSEDLDVASNAEFIALKEKVDLLAGDVDTDAIISNMKEVAAFLDGFAEDADLMDLLNSKVDYVVNMSTDTYKTLGYGRLDEGWKYYGPAISFGQLNYCAQIQVSRNADSVVFRRRTPEGFTEWQTLLHSGNYSDYALPLSGGTILSAEFAPLVIKRASVNGVAIRFENSGGLLGNIGIVPSESGAYPIFGDGTKNYTLIHAGNIGSQYVKGFVQVGANASGRYDANELVNGGILVNSESYSKWDNAPTGANVGALIHFAPSGNKLYSLQMFVDGASEKLSVRNCLLTQAWSSWKQLAFTNSDITGYAAGLKHSNGTVGAIINSSGGVTIGGSDKIGTSNTRLWVDGHARFNADTYLTNWAYLRTYLADGSEHSLIGVNNKDILYINDGITVPTVIRGGGVTIGASDLAGTSAKLYVDGSVLVGSSSADCLTIRRTVESGGAYANFYSNNQSYSYWRIGTNLIHDFVFYQNGDNVAMTLAKNGNVFIGSNYTGTQTGTTLGVISADDKTADIFLGYNGERKWSITSRSATSSEANGFGIYNHIANAYALHVTAGNNVLIGTTTDDGVSKLQVAGNITATGEISCGGAGEEGTSGGGASVFQHVFTPSASPSVRVLHNLGTEDIVITLYEKDATSGLWSVCLTDIEIVSANEVTITFGSTSNQEHKVVIMGGAA